MAPRLGALVVVLAVSAAATIGAQTAPPQTAPPVPKPFPQPVGTSAPPPAKPADPQTSSAQPASPSAGRAAGKPTEADLGVKFYPGSDFLDSYDAGRGQRYYLFGTNDSYADVVAFFKRERGGGKELFKAPPMQQFDLDTKFREETMAFPPSVIVKDYTWNNSEGYLFVEGTRERRFKTIVQIVPAPVR